MDERRRRRESEPAKRSQQVASCSHLALVADSGGAQSGLPERFKPAEPLLRVKPIVLALIFLKVRLTDAELIESFDSDCQALGLEVPAKLGHQQWRSRPLLGLLPTSET
jgi:hypothetical protein